MGAHFHCEGSRVLARQVRRKVEFAGKLLRIRRSRKQRDSNESWNWLLKSGILGALLPVHKNTIAAIFPDPTDRPSVSEDARILPMTGALLVG